MSARHDAIILNQRIELEAYATRRAGMIAANISCEHRGLPPKYSEDDFIKLEADTRSCWLDATLFD